MQERARQFFDNLKNNWNGLNKKVKTRIFAVTFIVFLSLGITIYLMLKPNWVNLTSNDLKGSEISEVQKALDTLGYVTKLSPQGTGILIEEKYLNQAKVDLSTADIKTQGVFTFDDAIKLSGMGSTELIKKASLRRFAESKLAQDLMLFDGIVKAEVNLAIPENINYFREDLQKPQASVFVTASRELSSRDAEAIARYVSASVVDLGLENIEVVDNNYKVLFSGENTENSSLNETFDIEYKRRKEMESTIRANLKPLFDEVQIILNLNYDWDKEVSNSEIITPPIQDSEIGVVTERTTDNQKVTNGTAEQNVGVDANNNQTPEYQLGEDAQGNASIKQENAKYGYNKEAKMTEKSLGKLIPEKSNMLVSVYRYKEYKQDMMEKNNLLQGTNWEMFKSTTVSQKIDIDEDLKQAIIQGTGIANVSIIGYEVPYFTDKIINSPNIGIGIVYGTLALLIAILIGGILKTTKPIEMPEVEPELEVEELLVSTKIENEKEKELTKLEDIDFAKESETKRKIEKFVTEKPEAVAQLLRNWLSDDWGE